MQRIIATMLTLALALAMPAAADAPACGPYRPIPADLRALLDAINAAHLFAMQALNATRTEVPPLSPAWHAIDRAWQDEAAKAERNRAKVIQEVIRRELAECGYVAMKPVR